MRGSRARMRSQAESRSARPVVGSERSDGSDGSDGRLTTPSSTAGAVSGGTPPSAGKEAEKRPDASGASEASGASGASDTSARRAPSGLSGLSGLSLRNEADGAPSAAEAARSGQGRLPEVTSRAKSRSDRALVQTAHAKSARRWFFIGSGAFLGGKKRKFRRMFQLASLLSGQQGRKKAASRPFQRPAALYALTCLTYLDVLDVP